MRYRISGLPVEYFLPLFALDDAGLAAAGVERHLVDAPHAYPCRITLEDADPGEEVLLLSYGHQPAATPYASTGPIFVRRAATATRVVHDHVPEQQRRRLLSVRAYSRAHAMIDAEVVEGTALDALIGRYFANGEVGYLHVHNARRGCYACRVDRAHEPG